MSSLRRVSSISVSQTRVLRGISTEWVSFHSGYLDILHKIHLWLRLNDTIVQSLMDLTINVSVENVHRLDSKVIRHFFVSESLHSYYGYIYYIRTKNFIR